MEIGCFSISLAVKDLTKSQAFYENLGFEVFAGDPSQNYLIMKNGSSNIGLFEGMFEGNLLTFNPGWDQNANKLEPFQDVREIHRNLKSLGVEIADDSIRGASGPSSFAIVDPDGNKILFDQHV